MRWWRSLRCALKWSKGSRQALHTHSDLHAVDPKRLSSRVSGDPHCGQRTDSATSTVPVARGCGGAMPYVEQLALAGVAHPVGGPGRATAQRTRDVVEALASQGAS